MTPSASDPLTELLLAGEIEAIIAPPSPAAFEDRSGKIVRLFSDTQAVEEQYYRRTGIYPIMHVLVLRADANVPRSPSPGAAARATAAHGMFGEDLWPYGSTPTGRRWPPSSATCTSRG